ncbi:CPBP family intramembrane glutamic endopeptidase [Hymenobacter sediminicola]|uniref:CPBP family intramembrane metalloprotease n=1 Tax=Hymenobacter sediminicola TaxID=2761579 RepID=A0A7G7W9Z9_9BACT|nr:type II CAAX endopeptidase family protein [Hymenobacter sediminicola]QNH63192.1 CPBP family intramembrane metalloprotease [Hymenobacter sediminicola]
MKKPAVVAAVTLATFLLAVYGPRFINPLLGVVPGQLAPVAYSLYMALWWLGLPMLALAGLYGFRRVLPELGWKASVGTGLLMGLVCTLPMLLGYMALFPVTTLAGPVVAGNLVRGALWAGLGEETLFRGFLFGQLYRKVRFPWLLTILIESGIFATGHLYQSHDLASAAGVLAVTFSGGVWFGWLYKSWNNLWVPVFLHVFMNAWWMLFEVSDTALGNVWANVFRVLTIGLSVAFTLWYQRHRQPAPAALALA